MGCCLLETPEECSCQINILQCTLEGVNVVANKCNTWKSVTLCYCSGIKYVFVVVVEGGYLFIFMWVAGSCMAVSGLEVLVGIGVYEIVCYFVHSGRSGHSPPLLLERAEAKVDPDTSQL